MAVISVALAAGRGADSLDPYSRGDVWAIQAMAAGFAGLASLLALLPLTWCILRMNEVGQGVGIVIVYTLAAGAAFVAVVAGFGGLPPDGLAVAALFIFLGSLAGTIAGALGLARSAGYRLEVGRPDQP